MKIQLSIGIINLGHSETEGGKCSWYCPFYRTILLHPPENCFVQNKYLRSFFIVKNVFYAGSQGDLGQDPRDDIRISGTLNAARTLLVYARDVSLVEAVSVRYRSQTMRFLFRVVISASRVSGLAKKRRSGC